MKKINISQIDTLFVNGNYPIEFLFFYKQKIKTINIIKVLKRISSTFWPLFGIYNDGMIQFSKYSVDKFCCEMVYDEDFTYAKDEMEIWEKYNRINPPKMDGLFFLSILQFNNGTVIIPKMNHLIGDGYSYFYFLSVLAATAKSSYIPFKKYAIRVLTSPQLNRTVLKPYRFNKTKIEKPDEHQNCTIKIEKVKKTYVKEEIKKIKTNRGMSVSTNDILSALILKKMVKYQVTKIDSQFILSIPMDVRRYVKELGPKYFGNGLMLHNYNNNINELDKCDIGELSLRLRNSIPSVNTESYIEYLNDIESKIEESSIHSLKPYDPEKGCLVTNLSKMPIQRLNFGTGSPEFVFLLTIGKNSTAILTDKDDYLLRLVH